MTRFSLIITASLVLTAFTSDMVCAQIKQSGNENSNDFYIITTRKTDMSSGRSSKKIEYYYKGKRYTVDYWAKHFIDIVKESPNAIKEIKKYRIKMGTSTVLGTASFGFLIGTFISSVKKGEFNAVTAGLALATGISSMFISNSRDKNIIKAAEYYQIDERTMHSSNFDDKYLKITQSIHPIIGLTFTINI